jgi:sigma-B regulation protein RsbU (phosphoserine phosphatase)
MISAPRPRILAVDDDPGILRAVSRVFSGHYQVTCAPGPAAALECAGSLRPDVAIIDIRMPEMNGIELMKRLHAATPELDVILMTGNAQESDANLVQAIDAGAFYFVQKPFERRVLLALVARCLELRRLREEKQQTMLRMQQDLEEAQQFQMSLLPPPEMDLAGLSICARRVACHALAGDFYDYVGVAGDGAAVVIADVVGHGTSAAMMTGIVKAAFHAARVDDFDPLAVVNRVKDGIRSFDAGRFITLCCARFELGSRRLVYANAGHPPLIFRRAGGEPVLLESTGPLISSHLIEVPCETGTVTLGERDFLLFYTDGVAEAEGPGGSFGRQRIVSLLTQNGYRGPQFLDRVLSAVDEFSAGREPRDDMTLLAAEITGPIGHPVR